MKKLLIILGTGLLVLAGCKTIESIDIVSEPYKTVYGQGQQLNLAGLSVVGTYSNSPSRPLTNYQISGYDRNQIGEQRVAVSAGGKSTFFTITVKPLLSISVLTPPTKTLYKQGDVLDLQGLVVIGKWEELGEGPLPITVRDISGYNANLPGDQTLTVTMGSLAAYFQVSVRPLSLIRVAAMPAKTVFKQGEALDLTGLIVTARWDGIGEEQIKSSLLRISGYNPNTSGTQTLTITYGDKQTNMSVTVRPLSAITVTQPPAKTVYLRGEPLDISGIVVTGRWDGFADDVLPVTADNVFGYNPTIIGTQTLTVTINSRSSYFTVVVKTLSSIIVSKQPFKTTYEIGEPLNISGLEITGTFTDGSRQIIPVTPSQVTGYNPNLGQQQTLRVTVDGNTATFMVTVRVLSSISIARNPNKIVYNRDEHLSLDGLVVVGTYTDASTRIVPVDIKNISGFDSSRIGNQTVLVTINGKGASFTVTVLEDRMAN